MKNKTILKVIVTKGKKYEQTSYESLNNFQIWKKAYYYFNDRIGERTFFIFCFSFLSYADQLTK